MHDAFAEKRIDKTIEVVCQRGCEYVRQVIVKIESGKLDGIDELREAGDSPRVLAELKEIMSVYDESGGTCCPVPLHSLPEKDIKKASR